MAEYKTTDQNNYGFPLTFDAAGKFPIIAKRIWATLDDAMTWVNDPNEYAIVGLQLSIINDSDPKKNGVYIVTKIGEGQVDENGKYTGGELTKVGAGEGSMQIEKFTIDENGKIEEATSIGQIIYITVGDEIIEGESTDNKYPAGPYIVTGEGTVAKLGTTTASGDLAGDVSALQGKVSTLETWVNAAKVKDVQYDGTSMANGDGIVDLSSFVKNDDLPTYTIEKLNDAEEGYAASYKLMSGETQMGATINIPKDMVVSKGEVRELVDDEITEDRKQGLYIVLTIANKTDDKLYIPVDQLIDNYNQGDYITITDGTISVDVNTLGSYFNDKYDSKGSAQAVANELSKYVTNESLTTTLQGYVTNESLTTTLQGYVTNDSLTTTLSSYYTKDQIDTTLQGYVTNDVLDGKNFATVEYVEENYINKNDIGSITTSDIDSIISGENTEEPEIQE